MTETDAGLIRKYRILGVVLVFFVGLALICTPVWAGPYARSAHGDAVYGVARIGLASPGPYAIGNCAHCHEQHAGRSSAGSGTVSTKPSPFALFARGFDSSQRFKPYQTSDVFCFYCHTTTGSYQGPGGSLLNYDYTNVFAGYTEGPASIYEAFNQPLGSIDASYHNLYDVWRYAQRFSYFSDSSTPCSACHNPHRARRNQAWPQDPAYTAISRPTDHESLWGDGADERMSAYGRSYQAPLYFGSKTTYEPGGVGEIGSDGSKTPDYNKFCMDCHRDKMTSTTLTRDTVSVEWKTGGGDSASAGDKHGANAFTGTIQMRKPYDETITPAGGYLLSCLDCHEPHGSPNAYLVRRAVNGTILEGVLTQNKEGNSWSYLCGRCHLDDAKIDGANDVTQANRWRAVHHDSETGDAPYPMPEGGCDSCHELSPDPQPIGCGYCHGHGSYCDSTHPGTLPNGKTISAPTDGSRRRTF